MYSVNITYRGKQFGDSSPTGKCTFKIMHIHNFNSFNFQFHGDNSLVAKVKSNLKGGQK